MSNKNLYRKLNIKRVIRAMEKADPTLRVSMDYDEKGKVIFVKRPKTDKELKADELLKSIEEVVAKKVAALAPSTN